MTLLVTAYRFDAEGVRHEIELESDLAGFESGRHELYGSALAVDLGLRLLPQLRHESALYVVGAAELQELHEEVRRLYIALEGRADAQYWQARLSNIHSAIELALRFGDDGQVWVG